MKRTVAILAALLALTGCSTGETEPDESTGDASVEAFVACLKSERVEAKISEIGGMVMVKTGSITPSEGGEMTMDSRGDGPQSLMSEIDEDGNTWEAPQNSSFFVNDPDTQDAYAACEARFTDFAQPAFDPMNDPDVVAMQEESAQAALEFAQCARDNGFSWVADPEAETGGNAIELPETLTEGEFRSLLESCLDPTAASFGWVIPDPEPFDWGAVLEEFLGDETY